MNITLHSHHHKLCPPRQELDQNWREQVSVNQSDLMNTIWDNFFISLKQLKVQKKYSPNFQTICLAIEILDIVANIKVIARIFFFMAMATYYQDPPNSKWSGYF